MTTEIIGTKSFQRKKNVAIMTVIRAEIVQIRI